MTESLCAGCGARLEEGASVCPACGQAASPGVSAQDDEEDFSRFADLTGFDVFAIDPNASAANRPSSPRRASAPKMAADAHDEGAQGVAPASQKEKSHLNKAERIAIGAAAVTLALAGIGMFTQPRTVEGIQEQLAAAQASTSEALASQEVRDLAPAWATQALDAEGAAGAAADENAAFDALVATYDGLQSYNERVYSCVQAFNGAIFLADTDQRESAAGVARSLLAEMDRDLDAIDALGIGAGNDLYDDYTSVRSLLEDQRNRLGGIVECWDISLGYSDPYSFQDEILAPLRRDTSANGTNVYLDDFDENYWGSRPTR